MTEAKGERLEALMRQRESLKMTLEELIRLGAAQDQLEELFDNLALIDGVISDLQ